MLPIMAGTFLVAAAAVADTLICDCDEPAAWEGAVEQDTAIAKTGTGSLKWTYGKAPFITLRNVPRDWTIHNTLSFWMHCDKPQAYRPWIVVTGTPKAEEEDPPWAIVRLHLRSSGWHRFTIPFEEFEVRRGATMPEWKQIASLAFDCRTPQWQLGDADPATVLHIDDIRLTTIPRPAIGEGPRMTDAGLFSALDLERPELKTVKKHLAAGNIAAAKHALAEYMRSRRTPRWFDMWWEQPGQNPTYNTTRADELVAHRFRMGEIVYEPKGRIDWAYNPEIYSTGPKKTKEYNAALNRFYHIKYLHEAYWHTGRDEYVAEIVNEIVAWIEDCPVPLCQFGNSPYIPPWQTLSTAARIIHYWLDCIFRTLNHPAWTDDAIIKLLKSMHEHGDHLLRCHSDGTNWLTSEARAMVCLGMLFPEFRHAVSWRESGIGFLQDQLEHEIYPDGLQYELAIGYHGSAMRNFASVPLLAAENGTMDQLPDSYLNRLEKMGNYLLAAMMPDKQIPGRNDSYERWMDEQFEQALKLFPEREVFRWGATRGAEGLAPAAGSTACPYAGHYIMRTGWDADNDLYLLFDAGPFGAGHQHEDKLGFILYAYGRILIADGGVHQYNESPERKYVLSTRAHNTIRVDHLDQRSYHVLESHILPYPFTPLDNIWISDDTCDFVRGQYDHGYGTRTSSKCIVGVAHTRSILFVKPHYWVILDTVIPADNAEHDCESLFHLNVKQAAVDGLRVETDDPEANVALFPVPPPDLNVTASIVSGQREPEFQGWKQHTFTTLEPTPTAVFCWNARGPSQLATIIVPIRPGEPCPIQSVNTVPVSGADGRAPQATAVEIVFADGRRHTCAISAHEDEPHTFSGHTFTTMASMLQFDPNGKLSTTWDAPPQKP